LRRPSEADGTSWHLYSVQIDFAAIGQTRTEVMQSMQNAGVGSQVLYIPVHLQPWYRRQYGYGPGKCPVAEAYYQKTLSLPLYPAMSDAEVDRVIEVVGDVVERGGQATAPAAAA
jgi:dTDP-4-amino-4,6-dideoxygalactose transaminase